MREEKQFLLDEIEEMLDASGAMIITRYAGLNAAQAREFRDRVAGVNGDFEVVKKRVLIKAAEKRGIPLRLEQLGGHIGVIFGAEDGTDVSKVASKYGKESGGALEILLGWIDGELLSKEDVEMIAKLPSQQELRAQFVGLLEAPAAQTLSVMNALLSSVPAALEEKAKKQQ